MADPTPYTPGYDFSAFQSANPNRPLPGDRVDTELADIAEAIDQTIDGLKDIRRSDGALKSGIVTADALAPDLRADVIAAADRADASAALAEDMAAVATAKAVEASAVLTGASINLGNNLIRAADFATFTDSNDTVVAQENSTVLQAAIDALSANGGGEVIFDAHARLPLMAPLAARSDVILNGRHALIENLRTANVVGLNLSANALVMGSGALIDDDDYTWVAIKAAAVGQDYVEAVNGSTAWTAVGQEIQFLRATVSDFGGASSSYNFDSHHIRRVVKIASGRVYLDRPVQEAIPLDGSGTLGSSVVVGSGWAADVSFATASGRGVGLVGCAPRHAISRATVADMMVKSNAGLWMSRMMMHDCLMEDIRVLPSETTWAQAGLLGNFVSHSTIRGVQAPFWTRGLEVVGHSKNSVLANLRLWKHLPAGVVAGEEEETQIRAAGEKTRGLIIRDSHFDCGTLTTPTNIVTFSDGSETRFTGNTVVARNALAMTILSPTDTKHSVDNNRFIGTCATGVRQDGAQNAYTDNIMTDLTASSRAVLVVATAIDGAVSRNFFAAGSTALVDTNTSVTDLCEIADNDGLESIQLAGRAVVQNNRSRAVGRIRAALIDQNDFTPAEAGSTTEALNLITPWSIPAGALTTGDILEFDIAGSKSGAAGTATVFFNITTNTGVTPLSLLIPAANGTDWIIKARVTILGTTRFAVAIEAAAGGSVIAPVQTSYTGHNLTDFGMAIAVTGSVAVSGDKVLRSTAQAKFNRRGF